MHVVRRVGASVGAAVAAKLYRYQFEAKIEAVLTNLAEDHVVGMMVDCDPEILRMLRWLIGICGRLFRQTDHESGSYDAVSGDGGEPSELSAATMPLQVRRKFMLAARIASTHSLNVPVARAREPKPRVSSTKPTPKPLDAIAKKASVRRAIVLAARQPAKPAKRTAEVVRLRPRMGGMRPVRVAKAA
ncbi:MAG: hypothetical protein ACKVP7_07265 [Hyphomicrobiaceae bacterium]